MMGKLICGKYAPIIVFAVVLLGCARADGGIKLEETATPTSPVPHRAGVWRPSFWTKTANDLRESSASQRTMLRRLQIQKDEIEKYPKGHKLGEAAAAPDLDDLEARIINDGSFAGLREFADRFINETVNFFNGTAREHQRSYGGEEQQQYGLWDDKDQTYHSSSYSGSEYDPVSYHHHHLPQASVHYYPPQKKDDAFLTKVAIIALLKLIFAKLKAIGFLKILFLFMMKVPVMFFKFLFVLKGFKLLKLFTVPFLMATFAAPLLPLLPLLAPLLLGPLLLVPLLLPLLIPLLFFLPIIPVTTPVTAAATTRKRRETVNTFNFPANLTTTEDRLRHRGNDTRFLRGRKRPSSYDSHSYLYPWKVNQHQAAEDSPGLLELAHNLIESQHCMERVACELANQNDSKIYHAAVEWALDKVQSFANNEIKHKIERYSEAYKNGAKWRSSDICQNKFRCQKPRILLIQGRSKYNVF